MQKNMLGRLPAAVLCLLLLVAVGHGEAQERVRLQGEGLVILHDPTLRAPAHHLRQLYPELKRDVEQLLGLPLRSSVHVVLMEDRAAFESLSGSPFTRAFAAPRRSLIVIHVPAAAAHPRALNDLFKHELCHLVLHENIPGHLLPRWLDEGICQWVSGSLGELLSGAEPGAMLTMTRQPFPLDEISQNFPQERLPLFLAYYQSRNFVEYLSSRYGRDSLMVLLQHLRAEVPLETALRETFHADFAQLEAQWREQLRSREAVFLWLSRHIHEILFSMVPLGVVLVVVLRSLKRRRMQDEEEEEDL